MLMLPTPFQVCAVSFDESYFLVSFGDHNSSVFVTTAHRGGEMFDAYVVINGHESRSFIGLGEFGKIK